VTANQASAGITFKLNESSEQVDKYDGYTLTGTTTETTTATGTNNTDSRVNVAIYDDGRFEIEYEAGGVTGNYTMTQITVTRCNARATSCHPTSAQSSDAAKPTNLGGVSGTINGKIDPAQPNLLSGTMTDAFDRFEGSPGRTTISWNLKR
jgi:hypothetical protein